MSEINFENGPRLSLEPTDPAQDPGTLRKILNRTLDAMGLAGFSRKDTIQKAGKQPSLRGIEGKDRGAYPYSSYDSVARAPNFDKLTKIKLQAKSLDQIADLKGGSIADRRTLENLLAPVTPQVKTKDTDQREILKDVKQTDLDELEDLLAFTSSFEDEQDSLLELAPLEEEKIADEAKVVEEAIEETQPTEVITASAALSVDESEFNVSIVKEELNRICEELSEELAKGEQVNYGKLEELIRQFMMLAARNMGNADEEYRKAMMKTQKIDQTENIQTMKGFWAKLGLGAELAGSAVTAFVGGLGSGIQSARGLASSAETLSKFGQLGQIGQSSGKVVENQLNMSRTRLNYQLDRIREQLQQTGENKRMDEQQQQQLKNTIDEMLRNMHQIFSSIASASSS